MAHFGTNWLSPIGCLLLVVSYWLSHIGCLLLAVSYFPTDGDPGARELVRPDQTQR